MGHRVRTMLSDGISYYVAPRDKEREQ